MEFTLESFKMSGIRTSNIGNYISDQGLDNESGIVYPIQFGDGKIYYVYIGTENNKYYLELLNNIYYSNNLEELEDILFKFVSSDMEVISVITNN